MLQIRLLGQFDLRLDGKRVLIPSRSGQSLFAYLVLSAGTSHRREKLAGILWPDFADDNARKNLRHELWRIRKALSTRQSSTDEYLLAEEFTIAFNREAGYWLDAVQLERPELDLGSLISNLSLYHGELLPGFYEDWIVLERERIQAIFDTKMEQLLGQLIGAERWTAVQEQAERWLSLGHTPEAAYRALMLTYGARGDMAKVSSIYQRCMDELDETFGLEPSAETRALYDRLLKGVQVPGRLVQSSGTVTFLFTDIEESTHLLEKLGDQYATVLAEHHEILRAAIQKWNGHEVDTQGDAFFVTFARSLDAVQCAAEAQRALASHSWLQDQPLRVRMGLHTGEPLIASTGYVGMDVHRAARIGDAAHGGQVLLSQTTRELVWHDLPKGLTIRDLGEHRLKDLKFPTPIYQLIIEGLPNSFPPLRTKFTGAETPTPGEPPFKGLQYFEEADSDLFFGREVLTAKLVNRLRETEFLSVVIGASGSGKSSLVRAGLIPVLKKGEILPDGTKPPEGSAAWQVYVITPTAHPLQALATELTRESESVTATATLMDDLMKDPRSLSLFLARQNSKGHTLLVIDQFEELFTLCRDEFEREAFIDNLLTTLPPLRLPPFSGKMGGETEGGNITLVLTLRADFYAHLAQYPELRDVVARQQEYIGPMTMEELRRAIEEPARRGHWAFEPGLVDLILRDVGDEPGALPLLSHALLETWKRRAGHTLTLKGYAEAGGVRGAIAHTAESVYQNLSSEEQTIARNIFLRLTELGEGTEDTRRRASFDELISHVDEEHAGEARAVLNRLAEARLITLGEDTAEVAHEALIREWPALREWLNQDRESLRLHRHLTEAAHEWEILERDAGALYRGTHLAQAREWAILHPNSLNAGERAFLDASNDLEQREVREREEQQKRELEAAQRLAETEKARAQEQARSIKQLRQRALYLAVVLAIAVIAAVVAGIFAKQNGTLASTNASVAAMAKAEAAARATQQSIAEANFTHAEAQRLAAEATNIMSESHNSTTAALLTLRSLNLEYTPQGDAALMSAINLNYPVRIFTGHTGLIAPVIFSSDDKWILTGSEDNTARLLDARSGQQLQVFSGHTGFINTIALSADGKLVLTGSADKTARLWDAVTGKQLQMFIGHTDEVITVGFSHDSKQILTGSEDKTLRLWDIETGRELKQWVIDEPVSAFSPDGSYAVGYSETNNANELWDLNTMTKTHSISYSGPPWRYATRFSSDGKYLLAAYGKEIVLSDVITGQELQVFRGHTDAIHVLDLSLDGKYVLSGSADGSARLWDIKTGQELRRFSGHADVEAVAFSFDGQRILTGGSGGSVLLWDIEPHLELPIFNGQNQMFGVTFSPNGKFLATNVISNELRLWDVSIGQMMWRTQDSGLALWALKYSPDGKYLISGNMDGVTTLWDAKTGKAVRRFTAHGLDEIYGLAFSPDGKTIIAGGFSSASQETFAPIWDVETGKEILRIPLPAHIYTASFSPDGKTILTGGVDGASRLWDARTGKKLKEFTGNMGIFSPDGKNVATIGGSSDWAGSAIFIWDVQTGQEINHFDGPADGIFDPTYTPDGKIIAAVGSDNSVRLWNSQTGQELRRYSQTAPVNFITFSPDNKYVISVSTDGFARFFDVDYHTTMKYLCSLLLRDFTDVERAQYNITDHKPTCQTK